MKIVIDAPQLKKLQSKLANFNSAAASELNESIKKAILKGQRATMEKAPKNIGDLARSHLTQFEMLKGRLYVDKQYGIYVHEGTRPHMPPFEAIDQWARRKGLPTFAVMKAIQKRGTKAQPWFKEGIDREKSSIEQDLNNTINNILKKLNF